MRILLVEDDAVLARGLAASLKLAGFAVDHDDDGTDAAAIAKAEPYALVILDLGLPGQSGLEVLRRIRAAGSDVPVLILTARDALADRVKGLNLGADDYLQKPFEPAELEARVRALVRRGLGPRNPVISCGALTLDRSSWTVHLAGRALVLRRRELAILEGLMTRAGKVVAKEKLAGEVFGFNEPVAPNAIEVYIARLRKKLEPDGPQIRTVRGLGYMIERS